MFKSSLSVDLLTNNKTKFNKKITSNIMWTHFCNLLRRFKFDAQTAIILVLSCNKLLIQFYRVAFTHCFNG